MVDKSNVASPARWPALLDRIQVAEYLAISPWTLDKLVADGSLRPVLIRGSKMIRFRRLELDEFIAGLPRGDSAKAIAARQVGVKKQTSEMEAG